MRTTTFLTLTFIAATILACGEGRTPTITATVESPTAPATEASSTPPAPTPTTAVPPIGVTSELVAKANFPVTMAFASDGRLFYNEFLNGNIMVLLNGSASTFAHVDIFSKGECGLLGLAIDPDFAQNSYIYIYLIEPIPGRDDIGHPVIMRFTDDDGVGTEPTILVDDLPNTNPIVCGHVSGNLNFGSDGYLYFTIGEMEFKDPAQDLGSPLGKMQRINKEDGAAARDNPFEENPEANPRVWAYGLRNTFDFTFSPENGKIYAPENGLGNCDELNIVEMGRNYGHPESSFVEEDPPCAERAGVTPIYLYSKPGMRPETFTSNVAPTGVYFASGENYPTLGDSLLSCEWNTGFMRRLVLASPTLDQVIDHSIVVEDCKLDITADPEGTIYYSNPGEIRRLVPAQNVP